MRCPIILVQSFPVLQLLVSVVQTVVDQWKDLQTYWSKRGRVTSWSFLKSGPAKGKTVEAASVQHLEMAVATATGLLQYSKAEANRMFLKIFANKSDYNCDLKGYLVYFQIIDVK